jgi:hypothetical protein
MMAKLTLREAPKHTPGPWTWNGKRRLGLRGQGEDVLEFGDNEGMWVAINDRKDANAALIAAAPDLLAALIECSDRLHVHMAHSEDLIAQMQALKAIAKATGSDT